MKDEQEHIGILYEIEPQDDNSIRLYFDVFIGDRDTVSCYTKENILSYDTGLYIITVPEEQFAEFFNTNASRATALLDNWFTLKRNFSKADNSVEGTYYPFDFGVEDQPQNIFFNKGDISLIGKRKTIDKEFLKNINSLIDLRDIYDKPKTEICLTEFSARIKSVGDSATLNVVSFNVGQGSANGVFNQDFNPIFYYDLGGGAYWNKHTYKSIKQFPVTGDPFIILSHWDFDHYETIKADISRYTNCKIIAPLQKTTPSIRKFVAKISANLYLIDKELGRGKTYSFLKIFKCSGKTRNDSGLGIYLDLRKDDENISKILFPGDSQYCFIKQREDYHAICVSHHGGKLYNKRGFPKSKEKGNGYCVYSYGVDNTYNHPRLDTIQEHINRGWGIDRFRKKYSLSTTKFNVIYSCDLSICKEFDNSQIKSLGPFNSFHGIYYNDYLRNGGVLSKVEND